MNLRNALLHITKQLSEGDIELPTMEARILLSHVLGKPKEFLITNNEQELEPEKLQELEGLVIRRKTFEPIAYITGAKEFFGRDFIVDKNVLLPRPDSETLIEAVLKNRLLSKPACGKGFEGGAERRTGVYLSVHEDSSTAQAYKSPAQVGFGKKSNITGEAKILELGVGSGCLILTLLLELQAATGIGVDIDQGALNVANKNAHKYGIQERIELIESDWFNSLGMQKFDIIISNPPYISSKEKVAKETLLHEPAKALFADSNGLSAYIEIARRAKDFLKTKGMLYLEIGYDQEDSVTDLFLENGYQIVSKYKDLAGHVRCLEFQVE